MHLMVQLGVAQRLLSNPALQDQGLISRLVLASPVSTAGTRMLCPMYYPLYVIRRGQHH